MTTKLMATREQSDADVSRQHIRASGNTRLAPSPCTGGGLIMIDAGCTWDAWELATSLMITVSVSPESWLATTYLESDVPEYGLGESYGEAIADLLTSLSDYRASLEGREDRLGPPAVSDLAKLRTLLRPMARS